MTRAKPKPPSKRPAPPSLTSLASVLGASEPDGLLGRVRSTVDKGLTALDERITALIAEITGTGEYDKDLASHLAWLTKLAAGVLTDIRKLEDAERIAAGRLPPQLVMAYLRGLDEERRGHVVRELLSMGEAGESVLGT